MSRSYKHTPCCSDTTSKSDKRRANKKVRRSPFDQTAQYSAYKKIYESWDICDYKFLHFSYASYLAASKFNDTIEDSEESYQFYLKNYVRK